MYRIPKEMDLSEIVGQSTTQLRIGQYDLQFSLGPVDFCIESTVSLIRDGSVIGTWQSGSWPSPAFFDIMNTDVISYSIPDDRSIVIRLENGVEIRLTDDSDQFECMQISISGKPGQWII